jgi:hypothetical protein
VPESVAVQITGKYVVLAKATGHGAEASLVALVRREIKADEDALAVAAELIRQHGIVNLGLAVLVNWNDYSVREVWIPFTTESQIRDTIKFELEEDLGEEAADLLMPFQIVEQRPDSSHVLAWAATKKVIGELLAKYEGAGISPEYMPPDAMGHVGLVRALGGESGTKPVLVVSGDEENVALGLVTDGRTIWGCRRLRSLAWATEAAGQPLQEIRRLFLSAPGFPEPAAVISFGGEAADTLARVAADELGCPQQTVAPPAGAGTDGPALLHWPLAAGVALYMATNSDRPLTMRLEEFEPRETAQAVSLLGTVAVFLLGFCFLVGGAWCWLASAREKTSLHETQLQPVIFWKENKLSGKAPPLENFQAELTRRVHVLTDELKAAQSSLDAEEKLSELATVLAGVPSDVQPVEFSLLSVGQKGITLRGKTSNSDAADKLRLQFKNSREFTVEGNVTPRPKDTEFSFTLGYKAGK